MPCTEQGDSFSSELCRVLRISVSCIASATSCTNRPCILYTALAHSFSLLWNCFTLSSCTSLWWVQHEWQYLDFALWYWFCRFPSPPLLFPFMGCVCLLTPAVVLITLLFSYDTLALKPLWRVEKYQQSADGMLLIFSCLFHWQGSNSSLKKFASLNCICSSECIHQSCRLQFLDGRICLTSIHCWCSRFSNLK